MEQSSIERRDLIRKAAAGAAIAWTAPIITTAMQPAAAATSFGGPGFDRINQYQFARIGIFDTAYAAETPTGDACQPTSWNTGSFQNATGPGDPGGATVMTTSTSSGCFNVPRTVTVTLPAGCGVLDARAWRDDVCVDFAFTNSSCIVGTVSTNTVTFTAGPVGTDRTINWIRVRAQC